MRCKKTCKDGYRCTRQCNRNRYCWQHQRGGGKIIEVQEEAFGIDFGDDEPPTIFKLEEFDGNLSDVDFSKDNIYSDGEKVVIEYQKKYYYATYRKDSYPIRDLNDVIISTITVGQINKKEKEVTLLKNLKQEILQLSKKYVNNYENYYQLLLHIRKVLVEHKNLLQKIDQETIQKVQKNLENALNKLSNKENINYKILSIFIQNFNNLMSADILHRVVERIDNLVKFSKDLEQRIGQVKFDYMVLTLGSSSNMDEAIPRFALELSEKSTVLIVSCDPVFFNTEIAFEGDLKNIDSKTFRDLHYKYINKFASNPKNIKLVLLERYPGHSLLYSDFNIIGYEQINQILRPIQQNALKKIYDYGNYKIIINRMISVSLQDGKPFDDTKDVEMAVNNLLNLFKANTSYNDDCLWEYYYNEVLNRGMKGCMANKHSAKDIRSLH